MREIAVTPELSTQPSRRAFFAGASAAVLAPMGAAASPAAAQPQTAEENPLLLAIGQELDILLKQHGAADTALQAAEDLALATCPPVPESMKPDARHPNFLGSIRVELDPELDALGAPLGPFVTIRGQQFAMPTVASSRVVEKIIASSFEPERMQKQMEPHLAIARAYEAQREAALLAAGLPQATSALNAAAHAIRSLVHRSGEIEAVTIEGLLIKARVLQAAATTWDEHGTVYGRTVAAHGSEDLVSSVIQVLGAAEL